MQLCKKMDFRRIFFAFLHTALKCVEYAKKIDMYERWLCTAFLVCLGFRV